MRTPGGGYDENTFLYLLAIERARATRSRHPLRLLFATVEPVPGEPALIPNESAARLFESLRSSLRETDVTGWYRQDRVAGVVLSARDEPDPETLRGIVERVSEGLQQRLPSKAIRSLKVRIVQVESPRPAAVER